MYIVNPEKIENKFKCNANVANYLIEECNFSILSRGGKSYYFADTKEIREAVKKIPLARKLFRRIF